jgi:thioredoxin 1
MAENVLEFTDANFQADVLESDQPVLVDFWAPWCGPCKMIAPTIEELGGDYAGRAKIGKMNTDDSVETASKYGITSIPTILLFKNGEIVDRFVGMAGKEKFAASLDAQLG